MQKQSHKKILAIILSWQSMLSVLFLTALTHYLAAYQLGNKYGVLEQWWFNAVFYIAYILAGFGLFATLFNKVLHKANLDLGENLTTNEGYKPVIDGLRAIAVLVVVFYHAGFKAFPGGFIGVDVFFVISGYLITGHILNQLQKGTFTFSGFYEKRIRRILPALAVMLLVIVAMGSWLFEPLRMQEMAWSGVAAITSWANLLFLSQSDYFGVVSHLKPLLHTWSLAIEEQFYFLLPLLLFTLNKLVPNRFQRAFSMLLLTLTLLAISTVFTLTDQRTAFYSIQFRAWELLFGAVINYLPKSQLTGKKYLVYSITALSLILLPVFFYSDTTPFPGLAALPPVLGTAFLIYTIGTSETIVQRVLKLPFFTFLGKISYSLYLWHWPFLVLFRFYNIYPFGWLEYSLWLFVTLVVSTLSWRFIETPFRSRVFISKQMVFGLGFSTIALLAAGFYFVNQNGEFIQKNTHPNVSLPNAKAWNYDWDKWKDCDLPRGDFDVDQVDLCVIGDKTVDPSFLLIGDSHAQVLSQGMDKIANQVGRSGLLIVTTGRPPFFGINKSGGRLSLITKKYITDLLNHYPIEFVVMSSFWSAHYSECYLAPVKTTSEDEFFVLDKCARTRDLYKTGIEDMVEFYTAQKVKLNIVTQIPNFPYDVPNCVRSALYRGLDVKATCDLKYSDFVASVEPVDLIFNDLVSSYPSITLLHPEEVLCDNVTCLSTLNDDLLYFDDDHLSTKGSLYISDLFAPVFQNSGTAPK